MNAPHQTLNIEPLTISDARNTDLNRSKVFEPYFDPAILGVTVNEHDRRVLVYDEEKLIDLMCEQLKEADDAPDTVLREDGASSITCGLDAALLKMGAWAPAVV